MRRARVCCLHVLHVYYILVVHAHLYCMCVLQEALMMLRDYWTRNGLQVRRWCPAHAHELMNAQSVGLPLGPTADQNASLPHTWPRPLESPPVCPCLPTPACLPLHVCVHLRTHAHMHVNTLLRACGHTMQMILTNTCAPTHPMHMHTCMQVPIYFSSGMAARASKYYQLLLNWTNPNLRAAAFAAGDGSTDVQMGMGARTVSNAGAMGGGDGSGGGGLSAGGVSRQAQSGGPSSSTTATPQKTASAAAGAAAGGVGQAGGAGGMGEEPQLGVQRDVYGLASALPWDKSLLAVSGHKHKHVHVHTEMILTVRYT